MDILGFARNGSCRRLKEIEFVESIPKTQRKDIEKIAESS
jgi:hypothetical protein